MMQSNGGYTLVEITLALAASASMILLTVGLSLMVGRRQFETSLNNDKEFIQTQYNETQSNINSKVSLSQSNFGYNNMGCGGGDATGNSAYCYVMGRLITVSDGGLNLKSSVVIANTWNLKWPYKNQSNLYNLSIVHLYSFMGDNYGNDSGLNSLKGSLVGNEITKIWTYGYDSDSENTRLRYFGDSSSISKVGVMLLKSPVDGTVMSILLNNIDKYTDNANGYTKNNLNNNVKIFYFGSRDNTYDDNMNNVHESRQSTVSEMTNDDLVAYGVKNVGSGQKGGLICMSGGSNSAAVSINTNVDIDSIGSSPSISTLRNLCNNWNGE